MNKQKKKQKQMIKKRACGVVENYITFLPRAFQSIG